MYKDLIINLIERDTLLRNALTRYHFQINYELCEHITLRFNLNYVEDIYVRKLNIKSISGTNQKILKQQEILFNKILHFLTQYRELKENSFLPREIFDALLTDSEISKHL